MLLTAKVLYSFSEVWTRVNKNHHRASWWSDSDRQGYVLLSLLFIFYMKWIDNRSRVDKSVTFEAARSDFFSSFVDDLCCLHLLSKVFIMHLIVLQLLLIKVGIKISSISRCITLDQKPNHVNVVIKRQRMGWHSPMTENGTRRYRDCLSYRRFCDLPGSVVAKLKLRKLSMCKFALGMAINSVFVHGLTSDY